MIRYDLAVEIIDEIPLRAQAVQQKIITFPKITNYAAENVECH